MENTLIADKITELQRRLDALENANQPSAGRWQELNPSVVSPVVSAGDYPYEINFTDNDNIYQLSVGDRIKLEQDNVAGVQYFYIVLINYTTKRAYIEGRDDYELTADDITYFAYSKYINPPGFPQRISMNLGLDAGTYEYSSYDYSIVGSICTVQFFIYSSTGATDSDFTFYLPTPAGVEASGSGLYSQRYDFPAITDGHAPLRNVFLATVRIDGATNNQWSVLSPDGVSLAGINKIGGIFSYPIVYTN